MSDLVTDRYRSWELVKDEIWGPVGTQRRDRSDRNTERHLTFDRLAWAVLRPIRALPVIGDVVAAFWFDMAADATYQRPTLRSVLDHLAFRHLGDFLFWHKPITADFCASWWNSWHLPRRLRLPIYSCLEHGIWRRPDE